MSYLTGERNFNQTSTLYDEGSYLNEFQSYADEFVEGERLLEVFREQFEDSPFEFIQPQEFEPTEHSRLHDRLLRYIRSRENAEDSNDSCSTFCESDSDDGITVEIKQFTNYDKYLKPFQSNTQDCDTSNQSNVSQTTETSLIEDSIGKIPSTPNSKTFVVRVRNVATQFPEYDDNLINASAAEVEEPSSINMATQTSFTSTDENEETSDLCSTYDNAAKSEKQKKPKKKKKKN